MAPLGRGLIYDLTDWEVKLRFKIQVKKWQPNSWNVTHSYRWLFSNKFLIFAFFAKISTAIPHQSVMYHKLRFKIKWKNGGQIHETWHIHTDGYFQTIFSFLHFSSKFQLPHLTNIHAELLYWFLEWHWR